MINLGEPLAKELKSIERTKSARYMISWCIFDSVNRSIHNAILNNIWDSIWSTQLFFWRYTRD